MNMRTKSQTVAVKVETFLRDRRQAGFRLQTAAVYLRSLARFAAHKRHRGPITSSLVVAWVQASETQACINFARKLNAIQSFLQFWNQRDSRNELVPRGFFGPSPSRIHPHVFTTKEISDLVEASASWRADSQRRATYSTIFGLLAATGMRVSEALNLRCMDVDLEQSVLTVVNTKFNKNRHIATHPSVTRALRRYRQLRDADPANAKSEFWFAIGGRPVCVGVLQQVFVKIGRRLNWRCRGDHPRPRIHDLRHSFICRRIESWYAERKNVSNLMISLSTYVGHVKPSSTYWYLTATPRLMALAARRTEKHGART